MDTTTNKSHWDTVYTTKPPDQVSWTQEKPKISLDFIGSFGLGKDAKIIDIGGGDSNLVDFLLDEGYENITILDISDAALEKTKTRLGSKAEKITFIATDIAEFKPDQQYDIWHDRATFHFLTQEEQISKYLNLAESNIDGFMVLGTFSKDGPTKCSGLDIKQYDEESMVKQFENSFEKIECISTDHTTPFNTVQNFTFCSFKKR
ncbi:class I SAM-dependent methyltransferase [Chryseobacterium paridis]|uniref:Methyltransferase domain-containing protein n=1 Tax=Chryseobacterium paridis TaxID=2800328 RepID=A0ABS1G0R2_9FLAO|nr:class I SAM-dependent methyltransferase [Chryseobacterium paridis]MBK1898054.1 methyltransferase domain-containing protein [Chryseobacterium paridis]